MLLADFSMALLNTLKSLAFTTLSLAIFGFNTQMEIEYRPCELMVLNGHWRLDPATYDHWRASALQKSDSDVKAIKKQAENLTVEYDRLLEEHSNLQASFDSQHDKKSD
ncbi:hypothetical protein HF521_007423 [Silurus meridionalis]|uniref:Bap31/Bap29 cytoplasmic coiled-coil domain-containing protein n=1 Tax=Silurus meridionalis TaxID=175797 RepID=A0A8T0AUF6_SILME|nr:hypothetical protein HF521_007423 [Silurus meridionalis]